MSKKKRKGKSEKGAAPNIDRDVFLPGTVDIIHRHITETICAEVFEAVRNNERERKWSLFGLARFWTAVILEAPPSLTQLLEQARKGDPRGLLPYVEASAEAFFQKCKGFSNAFFMSLYSHFVESILPEFPTNFSRQLAHLKSKFSDIHAIDASKLDKIAHRLKILWNEEAAVLPGCVTAIYDLLRGFASQLWFDADSASSEFRRAILIAESLGEGTLLLGDRLYAMIEMFQALNEQKCFGVFRRNKTVKLTRIKLLSKEKTDEGTIEDWLVEAGIGDRRVTLRLICLIKKGKIYEALTNDLDPRHLSAKDIVLLYPQRWKVERLFFDLKEVLNLNRFYAANPNAVAMQVYAGAMVHAAFRMAQAKIAEEAAIEPEKLSPKKLFPRLALISIMLIEAEFYFEETCKANPGVRLKKPSWINLPYGTVSLRRLMVERRSEIRKKREFSKNRRNWKSFNNIEGGLELT